MPPAHEPPDSTTSDPLTAFSTEDARWMERALDLARHAGEMHDEVPVGAVLVMEGKAIGEGWNCTIASHDPTAHAEIIALRASGQQQRNYRLPGSTLYVTLEPCAMCAMALVHARVTQVIFATPDPKTGAAGSVFDTLISPRHNHRVAVASGLGGVASAALLRDFFRKRR